MATFLTYSASFAQNAFADAAVTRWRFNEPADATIAVDSVDALDGSYETGADPGAAGTIGDGAARFDGATGLVLVSATLSGTITVAAFGDSLVVNEGLNAADKYMPELDAALEARGLDATILDHGLSGRRVGEPGDGRLTDGIDVVGDVVADAPDVAIVELGTNDAINTRPLDTVQTNLTSIVSQLEGAGIEVLLTGAFGFYPDLNGGMGYATEPERDAFEAIFNTVASATGADLLRADGSNKFLGGARADTVITGGVLGDPALNLDGLHPNAAGVDDIVARTRDPVIRAAPAGLISDSLELANGSVELLFTADSVVGNQMLFSKNVLGGRSPGDIEIQLVDNEVVVGLQSASNTFIVQGGSVAAGEATHVVFTFGDGGMTLFVDGVQVDQAEFSGGTLGNLEELAIGARVNGTLAFDGVIDEVAVYDKALSAGEVEQLFEGAVNGSSIVGTAESDMITGGSDGESLRGAGGNDVIDGNDGNDELRGGGGADLVRGGEGDDAVFGGRGSDELRGGAGNDELDGKDGGDVLAGGEGDDLLQGSAGADELSGAGGNDELFGNRGTDELRGGTGNDLLNGGNGKDLLTGGPGSDTFQIDKIGHGVDKIFDFEDGAGGDILDLRAVLDFDGGNVDGFVRLDEVNGNTKVEVDANGGGDDFTAVFNLIGTTGLDIGNLVDDGNVQLNSTPS